MLSFSPRGVLDEILNFIESVSVFLPTFERDDNSSLFRGFSLFLTEILKNEKRIGFAPVCSELML